MNLKYLIQEYEFNKERKFNELHPRINFKKLSILGFIHNKMIYIDYTTNKSYYFDYYEEEWLKELKSEF